MRLPRVRIVEPARLEQTVDTETEKAWSSDRGTLVVRQPTPWVLLYVETGHLQAEFAPLIIDAYERATASGERPHVFVDCERLVTYDGEIRRQPSQWIADNRHRIQVQHMLVRSRFTRMGLQLASLFLGGIIVGHHERRTFEQALREAVLREERLEPPMAIC